MLRLLTLAVALGLTACTSRVEVSVEAFAPPPVITRGERILVLPAVTPEQQTLEHQTWVSLAEAELTRKGFTVTRSMAEATLAAGIGIRIDDGRDVVSTFSIPQWGVVGYSGANTSATVNRVGGFSTVNANTTFTPQYGVTGFQSGSRTDRVFRRAGSLTVLRVSGGRPFPTLFESRVRSEGSCGTLSAVAPNLIEALFATFPEGGTRRVSSPLAADC
jgi:hypothetical protein